MTKSRVYACCYHMIEAFKDLQLGTLSTSHMSNLELLVNLCNIHVVKLC